MYKIISFTFLIFGLVTTSLTAQNNQESSSDPFDLTEINSRIDELGVPTVNSVNELEVNSERLFDEGNCEEALPVLESFAKNANWLSNIIATGIEPYYGASYDSRDNFPYRKLKPLIPLEEQANLLRSKRNHSFVMQAECHEKLGNKEQAVALYIKALNLISLDDGEWWDRARAGLYTIVGVQE